MEIRSGRMVYLGYGKYWRSDAIVGLRPIEEERGPGRRTEVFTASLDQPIIASRSERAILRDMTVGSEEQFRLQEARAILADLVDALDDIPDVLRRMLVTEAQLDVARWERRIKALVQSDGEPSDEQNELFDE